MDTFLIILQAFGAVDVTHLKLQQGGVLAKPNIYITNRGCHDFSAAHRYGTLIDLTQGHYNLLSLGRMWRTMYPILSSSSHEDMILVCGPTIMNIVASSIFLLRHNKLNLLLYHIGRDNIGRYKKRTLIPNEEV